MTDKTELEVTQADRVLIEAIINDYHTTRLDSDYVSHILSKPRTIAAFARFARHRLATRTPDPTPVAWMPIESAPKDGSAILLYFPHRDLVIRGSWDWQGEGDWESGTQDWCDWNTDEEVVLQEDPSYAPTHWMPLPPAPDHIPEAGITVPPAVPTDGLVDALEALLHQLVEVGGNPRIEANIGKGLDAAFDNATQALAAYRGEA